MARRGGRRKSRTKSGFASVVRKLGGIRPAARTLHYDAGYVCMMVSGRRRVTQSVLDRIGGLSTPERPS